MKSMIVASMIVATHSFGAGTKYLSLRSRGIIPFLSSTLKLGSNRLDWRHNHTLTEASLSEKLSEAYKERNCDGVQDIVAEFPDILHENSAQNLLIASIEASSNNIGNAASIMNGLIASCVNFSNYDENQSKKAVELLEIMENSEKEIGVNVRPDIVSYCCAFSACSNSKLGGATNFHMTEMDNESEKILNRITHLAKKKAGGKRRKHINASHRKTTQLNASIGVIENYLSSNSELREKYPELKILYEDENYIGVSKPSGMICYHTHKTSRGKYDDISLEDLLLKFVHQSDGTLSTLNPEGFGIVHRLDRGTSGCILLAKNNKAHAHLLTAFFKRKVKKSYLALLPAHSQDNTNIDLPLGETGIIDIPVDGKPALSSYTVEQVHASPPSAITLRMDTFTGRKHQVRVHCAHALKRPLFLEPFYAPGGSTPMSKKKQSKSKSKKKVCSNDLSLIPQPIKDVGSEQIPGHRFFLHAESIQVPCLRIDMKAPLPSWWTQTINELR